jgi:hypothetical protein
MQDCNTVGSPFHSGMVINHLVKDGILPSSKLTIVKSFQKLMVWVELVVLLHY